MKDTILYKLLIEGKYSKDRYMILAQNLTYKEFWRERNVTEAIRSTISRRIDIKKSKNPSCLDPRHVSRILKLNFKEYNFDNFEYWNLIREDFCKLHRHLSNCMLQVKGKERFYPIKEDSLRMLEENEVIEYLRNNKEAAIIFDCGMHVMTPYSYYGGEIDGIINSITIKDLLNKNLIVQGVYFNCNGRKIYCLKETYKAPQLQPYIYGLDHYYLRRCGVKV